ncbi:TetR/AcrR family transcriptional regulator [Novipirellula artificiosorum]|uniref:Fatty acid metabolism regulator protein n=1 Tax=Novipirellula artificiosorum TaxID=2528016 RepID=A0A5C6E3C3_9BACT|nr:TetR/AcrR family transcriptional regulator [Novipirellula artificiosorum]TWU42467.1 Fatty acid metabolism regulator protein [Novipirellula artificiosorum]
MTRLEDRRKAMVSSVMREGIYEAAVDVLTEHGFDGLTMERVAATAGVGKASLYKYFANKQGMLQFVHAKAIEPVMTAVQAHRDSALPADQKLEAMLRTWFEYLGEHQVLFNLFSNDFAVEGMLKSEEVSARDTALQDIVKVLQEGIRLKIFRQVDAHRTGQLILGAVRQLVEQQLATEQTWPARALTREVMDFFLRGLQADRETQGQEQEQV